MASKRMKKIEKADMKWRHNNPERSRYLTHRTSARTFVRHYATPDDMAELIDLWKEHTAKK